MKAKYYLSPYHYDPQIELEILQNKTAQKITIKGNEAAIIRALAKYRLLQKSGITSCVNKMQPENRQKPNHDSEIHNLFKGGYIRKYSYPDAVNGRQNIVLFSLTQKGINYAIEKEMKLAPGILSDLQRYYTATALEIAAVNQWHLRLMDAYKDYVTLEMYEMPVTVSEDKNAIVMSCINFKNKEWSMLEEFCVAAIPFNKDDSEEAEGVFLNNLFALNSFYKTTKLFWHGKKFIVILTESFAQMEKVYSFLSAFKIQIPIYCALDEYVNDKNPLQWLYEITREDTGDIKYTLIDLTQKKKEENEKHE